MSQYINDPTIIALISAITSLIITVNTMLKQRSTDTKVDNHDRALNGELDKRIAETAAYAVAYKEATGRVPNRDELIGKQAPLVIITQPAIVTPIEKVGP